MIDPHPCRARVEVSVDHVVHGVQPAGGFLFAMAASTERRLVATEACHAPTRVKICGGMCSACGAEGAMSA